MSENLVRAPGLSLATYRVSMPGTKSLTSARKKPNVFGELASVRPGRRKIG